MTEPQASPASPAGPAAQSGPGVSTEAHAADDAPAIPAQGGLRRTGRTTAVPASGQPGATAEAAAGNAAGGFAASRAWLALLAAAAGMLAAGLILLVWPKATLNIVAILLGASLIVAGLLKLFEGFTARDETGGSRAANVVIGLLAGIAGLYCVKHQALSIVILAFVVGVFWVIHGITDIVVAAASGPVPGRGFQAIAGVLSLAAGLLVMFWPGISLVLLLTILGAWLIVYSVVLAALAFRLRRSLNAGPGPSGLIPAAAGGGPG